MASVWYLTHNTYAHLRILAHVCMHTYIHVIMSIVHTYYSKNEVLNIHILGLLPLLKSASWYLFQVVKSAWWMEMVCQCISTQTKVHSCPRILCPIQTFRHRAACPHPIHFSPNSSCLVVCHTCFRHRLITCQAWLHWAYNDQTTATHMEELSPQSWITLHLKWSWTRSILSSILSSILKILGKLPYTLCSGSRFAQAPDLCYLL